MDEILDLVMNLGESVLVVCFFFLFLILAYMLS